LSVDFIIPKTCRYVWVPSLVCLGDILSSFLGYDLIGSITGGVAAFPENTGSTTDFDWCQVDFLDSKMTQLAKEVFSNK
jgi:hypothetical protein